MTEDNNIPDKIYSLDDFMRAFRRMDCYDFARLAAEISDGAKTNILSDLTYLCTYARVGRNMVNIIHSISPHIDFTSDIGAIP